MKTIMISESLADAIAETWDRVSPDAGSCSLMEAIELTLDRVTGPASKELDELIAEFGYAKVARAAAGLI